MFGGGRLDITWPSQRKRWLKLSVYGIAPLGIYLFFVVMATETGYLFVFNLILSLLGLFVLAFGAFLFFRDRAGAILLWSSLGVSVLLLVKFGESYIRAYVYDAEVLLLRGANIPCSPEIEVDGARISVCKSHDF